MPVFFYLPAHYLPSTERRALWTRDHAPDFLQSGKAACAQCWIYQTCVELADLNIVEMVHEMPDEGIIVTLSNFLPPDFQAARGQFIAAIVADFLPHPGAQVQLLQNLAHARRLPNSEFIPLWPQPNIVPRNPDRGDEIRTVAYFGDGVNLAAELGDPRFNDLLEKETGVRVEIRGADRWHDYSDVDISVAVRGFGRSAFLQKPATKLYNAWLAGVPLIGGRDSAFSSEGRAGNDYLVARSTEEFRSHLRTLRSDPAAYRSLVEAGIRRAASRSRDAVRECWLKLLSENLPAHHRRWKSRTDLHRRLFWTANRALHFIDRKVRW